MPLAEAFLDGAADVPGTFAETGERLLPQLWHKRKWALEVGPERFDAGSRPDS